MQAGRAADDGSRAAIQQRRELNDAAILIVAVIDANTSERDGGSRFDRLGVVIIDPGAIVRAELDRLDEHRAFVATTARIERCEEEARHDMPLGR